MLEPKPHGVIAVNPLRSRLAQASRSVNRKQSGGYFAYGWAAISRQRRMTDLRPTRPFAGDVMNGTFGSKMGRSSPVP